MDPQSGVNADDEGADIQGGALLAGDPVLLQLDQLGDAGQGQVLRDLGQGHPPGGGVHPADIVHGPEELHGAVGGAVGLQTLKNLLGVVEHLGGGVDLQRCVGDDAGVLPALACVIVCNEHMVGKALAEDQSGGIRFFLQGRCAGDFDFHSRSLLFPC